MAFAALFGRMMRGVFVFVALVLVVRPGAARAEIASPSLTEVYDLIRTNLAGTDKAEIDRRATEALLSAFGAKVTATRDGQAASGDQEAAKLEPVDRTEVYEDQIGYVRLKAVQGSVAGDLRKAHGRLTATNKLNGLVLDLRFAGGEDYAAAAAAADLFIGKEKPLLDWGQGVARSKAKTDAIRIPVAVLVNAETSGSAEALAAALRESAVGLILGSQTAGRAATVRSFELSNGKFLRIAANPVMLGDGTPISSKGLVPDIGVNVSASDERAYYADAFAAIARAQGVSGSAGSATNVAALTNRTGRRTRFNEADLAREKRQGLGVDVDRDSARNREPDRPVINDPVLARAIDLLKGLAVVQGRN